MMATPAAAPVVSMILTASAARAASTVMSITGCDVAIWTFDISRCVPAIKAPYRFVTFGQITILYCFKLVKWPEGVNRYRALPAIRPAVKLLPPSMMSTAVLAPAPFRWETMGSKYVLPGEKVP